MNSRSIVIQTVIVLTAIVFSIRLFTIQVLDNEYKKAAQNNIIQKIIDYPYRGLIYDRKGELLVSNSPIYDLMVVPKEADLSDSTRICQLLSISHQEFEKRFRRAQRYSNILASKFDEQLPNEVFAQIQDQLVDLEGFYALPRTIRNYPHSSLANALGYVREISRRQLRNDTSNYYKSGDYIGITGIEKTYEEALRGRRGAQYKLVNVQGVVKGAFNEGRYDTIPVPGESIQLTIDLELQRYAEKLMENKVGSIVAIEPSTGEILAFVSAPSYDPNQLAGRDLGNNFREISEDSLNPLFNRPLQAMYPPGSMFKTIQALIAMQEGLLYPWEEIKCDGTLIGDHAPPGIYDVERAIQYSSNNYFYKVMRRVVQKGLNENPYRDSRIGLESWTDRVKKFGLGDKLSVDLVGEKSGYVPGVSYYDRVYGENRWRFSNIYSLSIGQGELLVTPIQMANLGALLANKGYYYTPHTVKSIGNKSHIEFPRNEVGIDSIHFESVINGMELVVKTTAFRAYIPDLPICGKTSTVQNPHGQDHSGFMGFGPMNDPRIAVAVYVENAGWGGRAAASTASLIIEKHVNKEIKRPWIENYVLAGDFSDPLPRTTRVQSDSSKSTDAQ